MTTIDIAAGVHLTDAQRLDWLQLIRSENIAPRGLRRWWASAAGLKIAERLARELGEAEFIVISGLARGIDAAAHRASLASGTIAVLAGGHDGSIPPNMPICSPRSLTTVP